MNTRFQFLRAILCALFTLFSIPSFAESKAPPNIVIIISDDQTYTDYSFMGHASIETPHLDRLAAQGTLFRRGYVPTALCRPSLMMLATGLYAHQNLTTGNDPAGTSRNAAHSEKAGKSARELPVSHIHQTGTTGHWKSKPRWTSPTCVTIPSGWTSGFSTLR